MKAVNLIPSDQRADAAVGAGRSGGVAYALLGLIAVIAVMAFLYGKASREISSQQGKVATLNAEAQSAQAQASALAPYTSFVSLREQRAQVVEQLVDSRFDWAHVFHEFGRVLGPQTSVSSLAGTVGTGTDSTTASSSTTGSSASTASTSSVSSATPPGSVPTFTLTGCATSQDAVAQMLQRLRLIDGADEVALQSAAKSGAASGGASGACPSADVAWSVGVTFDALPSTSAAAAGAEASTVSDQSTSASAATTSTTTTPEKAG